MKGTDTKQLPSRGKTAGQGPWKRLSASWWHQITAQLEVRRENTLCVGYFSHCQDEIFEKSNLQSLFLFTAWRDCSAWRGRHNGRMSDGWSYRVPREGAEEVIADTPFTFFLLWHQGPTHGMGLSAFRAGLPCSPKPFLKHPCRASQDVFPRWL